MLFREALAVVAAFTVAGVTATWPLARRFGDAVPGDLGDPLLNAWILAWDADRLLHGLRGLWNPPFFYPHEHTLAYSEHLLGVAIFTAPIQWLTGNAVAAYNAAFLGSFVLAGSGMYLLVRSLTGSRVAALAGGMAFAFLPYRAEEISHLQVLVYGWMPVALWGLHRYFHSGRRSALAVFAAAFLIQGFSNGYYFYFFAIAVIVVAGGEGIDLVRSRRFRPRTLIDLGVALAVMLAVTAPVMGGYLAAREVRPMHRTRGEMVNFSADASSYLDAARGTLWNERFPAGGEKAGLLPGFGLLLLAAVGLGAAGMRPRGDGGERHAGGADGGPCSGRASPRCIAAIYAAVGVVGFVLSLGPEPSAGGTVLLRSGPYDWLLGIVPGLDGLRVPSRAGILVFLALTVLASLGVWSLAGQLSRSAKGACCLVLAGVLVAEGYHRIPLAAVEKPPDAQAAYGLLRNVAPGAVLELPFGTGWESVPVHTLQFMHGALEHGQPIVNGYSGYMPLLVQMLSRSSVLEDYLGYGDLLAGLRAIGVRYIVVHEAIFDDPGIGRTTVEAIDAQREQWNWRRSVGSISLFELQMPTASAPAGPSAGRALDLSAARRDASHAPHRIDDAFDSDLATRWISQDPQAGDESITIELDEPADIAHVRLWMGRQGFDDYPRRLVIEGSADGRTFEELHASRGLPALLLGVVRPGASGTAPMDFALPPNRSRVIRLRQTDRTQRFYWSVYEVNLWER